MGKHVREIPTNYVDLVFEGGGIKAIGLVGALAALEEADYQPQNMAGTSAGAIVAALYAAGYSASDLYEILTQEAFPEFLDKGPEDCLPLIGPLVSVAQAFGLYEGERLYRRIKALLAVKDVHTFADLRHPLFYDHDNPFYRYRMYAVVSDLTLRRMLVLPADAEALGVDPDDLEVAQAVRMSTSIPLVFEPVFFKNPRTGRTHILVDGGLLSNFPVWLFDTEEGEIPPWPTFGLRLVEEDVRRPALVDGPSGEYRPIENFLEFLFRLVQTMVEAHDRLYIENADFARTIPIPALGIPTLKFHLSDEEREALYQAGYQAAKKFLETWDFQAYIDAFRQKRRTVSRRALLQQYMAGQKGE